MLVAPTYKLGGIELPMYPGDILNTNEIQQTINTDGVYTYLGPELASGDIFRTVNSANRVDILPTAAQLIAALQGNINLVTPPSNELYGIQPNRSVQLAWPANLAPFQPGSTFRRIITATTAFSLTFSAGSLPANGGMLLGAAPYDQTVVAASSWREFLFTILASAPPVGINVNQTTAQLFVTVPAASLDQIANVIPGMSVYGAGIPALTRVTSVNRDTGVIGISIATTTTTANNALTFTPTVVCSGIRAGTK